MKNENKLETRYIKIKRKILTHLGLQTPYKCNGYGCNKLLSFDEVNLDHIIPLGLQSNLGLTELGSNIKYTKSQWGNVQVMCRDCNRLKADKIDWRNPKTIILLNMFIQKAQKGEDSNQEKAQLQDEINQSML